jgi:SAM-dependent methyltransferase
MDKNMSKIAPKRDWFDSLTTLGLADQLGWIHRLTGSVKRVLSIGCWTSEPFAILWISNASELVVIEKNADYIKERLEEYERLKRITPEAFEGRSIEFIEGDVTSAVNELELDYFDLVFCENVLYNFQDDDQQLEAALNQMVRSVRPKGLIIANEPKYGAEIKMIESFLGPMPLPVSDPKDISSVFVRFGLIKIDTQHPYWTYIYQKP